MRGHSDGAEALWFRQGLRLAFTSRVCWAVTAIVTILILWQMRWEAPSLPRVLAAFAAASLAPAVLAFYGAGHLSAQHSSGQSEIATSPAVPVAQTFAPLGFTLGVTLIWGAATSAALAYAWLSGAAGGLTLSLPTVPLAVLVGGLGGSAAGRLLRHESRILVATLILGTFSGLVSLTALSIGNLKLNWLLVGPELATSLPNLGNVPPEVAHRPSGAAILYLGGMACTLLGLHRIGWRLGGSHTSAIRFAMIGTGVVLLVAGAVLILDPHDTDPLLPQAIECSMRDGITVCVLPGYSSWGREWMAIAEAVTMAIPEDARRPLSIVQYPTRSQREIVTDGTLQNSGPVPRNGGDIHMGLWWNRTPTLEPTAAQDFGLAFAVASHQLGLPTTADPVEVYNGAECNTGDQARSTVGLWLAASTDDQRESYFRAMLASTLPMSDDFSADATVVSGEYYAWYPMQLFLNEWWYASQLLDLDAAFVHSYIALELSDLRDPGTSNDKLIKDLDLESGPDPDPESFASHGPPCR